MEFDREKITQFFFAIKEQADEGLLKIENNSLSFTAKDGANVWFIDTKFNVPTPESLSIAIDCKKFFSTLNALKTKMITIDFAKTCHITGGKIHRDILSISESALGKPFAIPELKFDVCVEVPTVDYIELLEAIDKMGAEEGALPLRIDIVYDKNKFTFVAINELREKTHSEFDMISTEFGSGLTHHSGFSFDYLLKMAKIMKRTKIDNMKIYLSTDYPIKFELSNDIISIVWMLAPRIEGE